MNLSIVADQFGSGIQPFWIDFLKNLSRQKEISLKLYANDIISDHGFDIKPFRNKSFGKKLELKAKEAFGKRDVGSQFPILSENSDVVHFFNAQMFPPLLGRLKGRNLIFTFRGYDTLVRPLKDKVWKDQLLKIYDEAKILHFVSDYIKEEAIKLVAPREKCIVIRRSVDSSRFKRANNLDLQKTCRILSVGRLTWQKGFPDALRTINILVNRGLAVQYRIVGNGNDLDHLAYLIKDLGLESNVELVGEANRESLIDQFNWANIFFHPSVSEALPNAILEASSMELPVVASSIGGIPEAVISNDTALLSPTGDFQAFANSIIDLVANPDKGKKMGLMGREFMLNNFSPEREMKQWREAYSRAAN